jgi:hypothetical protein
MKTTFVTTLAVCLALPTVALAQTDQTQPQPNAAQPQPLQTTPPPPPPVVPVRPIVDLVSLKIMREKGIITEDEYKSARGDIAASVGEERAAEGMNVVVGKWSAQVYGFLETDFILDSTQSFNDTAGNAQVIRPLTYRSPIIDATCTTPPCPTPQPAGQGVSYYGGSNARLQFSVRNTRFGLRLRAPEFHKVRTSGTLEMDFLGFDQPSTEAALFNNPTMRIRHAYVKIETPIVDVLIGQYWHIFGWQPMFFPSTVEIQGLPGQLYERTAQVRFSHKFEMGGTALEIGAAALRPPTRDGAIPDIAGGLRFSIEKWRGTQTTGSTSTQMAPASIAVTGDYRDFRLPVFQQFPTQTVGLTTGAVAVDAFIPIVPARDHHHRGNTLSISGEFVYGGGIADMYTGLTGGVTQPSIVNSTSFNPAPPYPENVDNGMVVFDNNVHNLHAIVWMTTIAGLQWYLPGGHVWITGNYAHVESPNARDFTQTVAPNAAVSNYAQQAVVRSYEDWIDGNVFIEPHPAVRIGAEYAAFVDHYVDGVTAVNHRVQLSGFFLF